jgi:hypothetical protein
MNRSLLAALLLLAPGADVSAEVWHVLGPRATGMGGAFVAVAQGPIAQYWNPAGLAQEATASKWGLQAPVGAKVEFTGNVLQDANTLGDLATKYSAVQSAQTNGTALNADQMASVVKGIATIKHLNEPGKGVIASIEGGANVKTGRWAVSVNNFTSIGATPFVDTVNVGLGTISGAGGVSFNGVSAAAPADTTSRDSIASAINTIGYANLNNLVCGGAACIAGQNAGITNATTLANALVNQAVASGVSASAIEQAAATMAANAGEAATVIANVASGNNNPYTNNQSNLTVRGASFTEIAFGHGRALFLPGLMLGANLKMIAGKIGYERFNVLSKDAGSTSPLKDFKNNTASSVQPGLDLGVLWKLDEALPSVPLNPRFGLVARNINNPKFDQPALAATNGEPSKYSLNGQLRSGLAVSPFNWWNISADVDLTKNSTPIPGYQSQMLALGTEINIFNRSWINIPLRAGITKNITTSDSKPSYAAGFGFNFLHFIFDVGGSISSERTTIDSGDNIPSNAAVSAQLAFMFGGEPDSKKRAPKAEPAPKAEEQPAPAETEKVRQEAEKAQKALDSEPAKTP